MVKFGRQAMGEWQVSVFQQVCWSGVGLAALGPRQTNYQLP